MNININNHIALTSATAIQEICQPLFDLLNINYFSFHRTHSDGSKIRLCTNAQWTAHYLKMDYIVDGRLERHPTVYKSGYTLWDYWPQDDKAHLIIKDARDNFNRDHGFSIVKNHGEYIDIYNMTARIGHERANNLYLNSLEYIEKFIVYFMIKASPIIKQAEKDRFVFDSNPTLFLSDDHSGLARTSTHDTFFLALKTEGVYVEVGGKRILLTPRESMCAYLLCRGRTFKTIAHELNISPRTVETYINKIKIKIGVYSKEEIIRNIFSCEENNFLLLSESKKIGA